MLQEIQALKEKEKANFTTKLVVDSKDFKVNKMVKSSHVMDKFSNILEDPAKKRGF